MDKKTIRKIKHPRNHIQHNRGYLVARFPVLNSKKLQKDHPPVQRYDPVFGRWNFLFCWPLAWCDNRLWLHSGKFKNTHFKVKKLLSFIDSRTWNLLAPKPKKWEDSDNILESLPKSMVPPHQGKEDDKLIFYPIQS